ncbi:unnamed protein product [Macrosiphum euphorbiae]|uniref:Uncharacterized protein n=1 Tax=Macrosiphum euphorbiae TaxID=13131 RepID=A0AAV0XMG0_9HEMI|nr:unnamed protein product [Macrosiphum euphorbiae]
MTTNEKEIDSDSETSIAIYDDDDDDRNDITDAEVRLLKKDLAIRYYDEDETFVYRVDKSNKKILKPKNLLQSKKIILGKSNRSELESYRLKQLNDLFIEIDGVKTFGIISNTDAGIDVKKK